MPGLKDNSISNTIGAVADDSFACSDVVLVELSRQGRARVVDAFAADASSAPQPDEIFGGRLSLSGVGIVSHGETSASVVLRKRAVGESNHNIFLFYFVDSRLF